MAAASRCRAGWAKGPPSRFSCRASFKTSSTMSTSNQSLEIDRFPTGVEGLDVITRGGLLATGVYIIQGIPGSGKTILANEICYRHVGGGGRALYVTLLAESHTRMLQHLRPMAFFDESVIPDRLLYVSAF